MNESNSWKKRYLIILCTITVLVILGCVAYRGYKAYRFFTGSETANDIIKAVVDGDFEVGDFGDLITDETSYDDKIKKLDIDVSVADISVVYGDKLSVYYKVPQKLIPTVAVENDTLKIKQVSNGHYNFGNSNVCEIEITIPEGTELDNIDANLDLGNLTIDSIAFKNSVADLDLGNLIYKKCDFVNLEATCDLGNVEVKKSNFEKADIECDLGNVVVDGDFDYLDVDCSMGNVDVDTDRNQSEVTLKLEADMGEVKVNGKKWK